MKRLIIFILALAAPGLWAQDEFPLWEGEAPFAKPNSLVETVEEAWGVRCQCHRAHSHGVRRSGRACLSGGDCLSRWWVREGVLPGGGT